MASAPDLESAHEQIQRVAAKEPGEYILFCQATQQVVAVSRMPVPKAESRP